MLAKLKPALRYQWSYERVKIEEEQEGGEGVKGETAPPNIST